MSESNNSSNAPPSVENTPEQATQRTQGRNPNVDNAKRRNKNRPKKTNVSAVPKTEEIGLRWVDPLTDVKPSPADLQPHLESVPAGFVTLKHTLPGDIADPFCGLVESVLLRTPMSPQNIGYSVKKLNAQAYFKAARQLYSSLTDPQKSELQPLKSVFYDSAPVPVHMATALSMIGNFESKLGRVEVNFGPLLFKQWILEGLKRDPDTDEEFRGYADTSRVIWHDKSSKDFFNYKIRSVLEEFRNEPFQVMVGDTPIRVTMPPFVESAAGILQVSDAYPHAGEIRLLLSYLIQPHSDFIMGIEIEGQPLANALLLCGLEFAQPDASVVSLRDKFSEVQVEYNNHALIHIESVLKTGPAPASGNGFSAQTVKSDQVMARFNLPLSDADRSVGFMFSPCLEFELLPRFVAFSRVPNIEARSAFAKNDLRRIASDD